MVGITPVRLDCFRWYGMLRQLFHFSWYGAIGVNITSQFLWLFFHLGGSEANYGQKQPPRTLAICAIGSSEMCARMAIANTAFQRVGVELN